jgi:DNA-binding Lrp family transcriptional regulator
MSTRAYILIETEVGKSGDVVRYLNGLEGVLQADAVTGPYDVIAVVEKPSLNEVGDLLSRSVHAVGGITRTVTCLRVAIT